MRNLFFVILSFFYGCINCESNTSGEDNGGEKKDVNTYYEDINFSTFNGVKPIDKNSRSAFIEVLCENKDSLVIKVHHRKFMPEIYDEYDNNGTCINCPEKYNEYIEVFKKNTDYYYQFEEIEDDIPGAIIRIHKFFKLMESEIILIKLFFQDMDADGYSITKILLKDNCKEVIDFTGKHNEKHIKPNLDWEKLKKHPNAFSWKIYKYTTQNRGLAVKYIFKDLKYNKIDSGCNLYKGYPTKSINMYWNLYNGYYDISVDNSFNNCD